MRNGHIVKIERQETMAKIYIHDSDGCEFIVNEVGNELDDLVIHRYLCGKALAGELLAPGNVAKKLWKEDLEERKWWLNGDWRD